MTEEGYRPDNAGIGLTSPGEPAAAEAERLAELQTYNEAGANNYDKRVAVAEDPSFNALVKLLEARKDEFGNMELPAELALVFDKMAFGRKIEELGELREEEPDRAVGTAVLAMTDFLSAHPNQSLAEISMTSAHAVAKATEKGGIIPAAALGFVVEMLKVKAASQAGAATSAETGSGR